MTTKEMVKALRSDGATFVGGSSLGEIAARLEALEQVSCAAQSSIELFELPCLEASLDRLRATGWTPEEER